MRMRQSHFTTTPTLLSTTNLFISLLLFSSLSLRVTSRQVYHHLIYPQPNANANANADELLLGEDRLDEWVGVQGFHNALRNKLDATPSRQSVDATSPTAATPHSASYSSSQVIPTAAPAILNSLHRRGSFSSNVCPISTQTTIFVSVDGTSTFTVSSTVGPRPTGIPGDTGTSDGGDPNTYPTDNGITGGTGLSDKEGLITGLVIVLTILLASLCALITYFYKKRRNARIQRLSTRQGTDPAELVRRMGSKGIMSLSNTGRTIRRPHLPSSFPTSIAAFFTRAIHRLKSTFRRRKQGSQRDSQSSELLEWRKRFAHGHGDRLQPRWSEADGEKFSTTTQSRTNNNNNNNNNHGERRDGSSQQSRSPPTVPEVITSPAISAVRMPTSPSEAHANLAARSSAGSSSNGISVDFVPFVQRRVSTHHHLATARLSAVRPTIEPVKLGSTTDLGRPTSPRRNSRGEPLSPSAWMAGFGLGSNPNVVDPFTNPSYVSSSGGSHRGSYQSGFSGERERPFESGADLASPRSGAQSLASDRTPRGRHSPIQYQQMTRGAPLSIVAEHGPAADVRPDGASDIMSTFGSAFGDRPESTHSHATSYNEYHHPDQIQLTRYHALSDVEEVLTPVADERLSLRPGQEAPWRAVYESRASIPSPRQFPETVSSSPNSPYFSHLRSAADNTDTTTATATATQFRNPFASDEHVQIPQHSSPPPPQQQQQQYQQPRTPQRQHHHHQSSDADLANAAAMIPPVPSSGRNRRPPGPHRRKSEATSLSGILPSDASVAPSMTGTSIVERPHSLDTSEWDDPSLRRQQEERLFFSGSIASTPSENK
ncbi:hypothetical protein FRC18_001678 [Serendipita sp. 400]|nr:hypothetical protein FRC18_001678 [Serendipita sp. 400]